MILAVIQARLSSTRFPNNVMEILHGRPLYQWVVKATHESTLIDETIVAWAEAFPDIDSQNVLARFQKVVTWIKPDVVVRLTADCPLVTGWIIDQAIQTYKAVDLYYCNRDRVEDGYDVQVFHPTLLNDSFYTDGEHVIHPRHVPHVDQHAWSVDTPDDLRRVKEKMMVFS